MQLTYFYAIGSVAIVSLISLVGVFGLSLREEFLRKNIFVLIGLAVGALLGDVFIHILPEAFEEAPGILTSVLVILGIAMFFTLEKFFHWHHHGEDRAEPHIHPVGKLILFSDGVHNFIDGIIIGVSFLTSIPLGVATTLAVILHEIPQEIGDFAVLLHSGYEKKRALFLNFLSALAAVLGTVFALVVGSRGEAFISWALPIAAGGFIYIAMTDLIPELQKTKEPRYSALHFFAAALGVIAMILLTFLE